MKDKRFLPLIFVSIFLLAGCKTQTTKAVRAETLESSSLQQEANQSELVQSSSVINSETEESTTTEVSSIKGESSGSLEESQSIIANTSSTESVEVAEESKQQVAEIVQPPLSKEKVEENYQFSVVRNQTTDDFIQTIGKDAQQVAWDNGIYASVMIAQAILETGSGNSQLARPPYHNLFGIKGSYQGKEVSFDTQEDRGNGQLFTIKSAFRQYPSYKESLEDYAALLKNGLSGNPSFYHGTWKEYAATYQEATRSLTGKYATDTSYDKKLNALIETYELTSFDQEPNQEVEPEESVESSSGQQEIDEIVVESNESHEEDKAFFTRTKQTVVTVPPITQRPAKQVSGNQIVE